MGHNKKILRKLDEQSSSILDFKSEMKDPLEEHSNKLREKNDSDELNDVVEKINR